MKFRFAVVIMLGMAAVNAFVATLGARRTVSAQQAQSVDGPTAPAQQAQSVWDGVYTKEQAERGEPLYAEACASCHGADLMGGGEMAPGLAGGEFIWIWNGLSVGDLFERLRVSMPENDPGSVSRQQKADILAFILSTNDFPDGKTELASRTELLNQIKFEAIKQ